MANSSQLQELPIPPAAKRDPRARELARIWAAEKQQHVTLATGLWDDPSAWGIMLVDLARHVANAYAEAESRDAVEVLARIREGFDAEWQHATDQPKGHLLDDRDGD